MCSLNSLLPKLSSDIRIHTTILKNISQFCDWGVIVNDMKNASINDHFTAPHEHVSNPAYQRRPIDVKS